MILSIRYNFDFCSLVFVVVGGYFFWGGRCLVFFNWFGLVVGLLVCLLVFSFFHSFFNKDPNSDVLDSGLAA